MPELLFFSGSENYKAGTGDVNAVEQAAVCVSVCVCAVEKIAKPNGAQLRKKYKETHIEAAQCSNTWTPQCTLQYSADESIQCD